MAENETTATASPSIEPIVEPAPKLFEQFDPRWAKVWARPPLRKDGTEIADAADLKDAHEKAANTWQNCACHATCIAMLVNWLATANPATSGRVKIPNRADGTSEINPLSVAYWLWQLGDSPTKTEFVSDKDHPPYVPYKMDGPCWTTDHAAITSAMKGITLTTEGKPDEPLVLDAFGLSPSLPSHAAAHKRQRDQLKKSRAKVQEEIDGIDKKIANAKTDKERQALFKQRDALEKKLEGLDQKIDDVPVDDDGAFKPDWLARQRESRKTRLKRALLRGPVLLNMLLPGHFVLLFGYRDRTMCILEPGASIPRKWAGRQPDLSKVPAGKLLDRSRDVLAIDAEAEFSNIAAGRDGTVTTTFLDNLLGAESYYFKSLGEQMDYCKTEARETLPFSPDDVR